MYDQFVMEVSELLSSPSRYSKFSQNGYVISRELFDAKMIIIKYEECYLT